MRYYVFGKHVVKTIEIIAPINMLVIVHIKAYECLAFAIRAVLSLLKNCFFSVFFFFFWRNKNKIW